MKNKIIISISLFILAIIFFIGCTLLFKNLPNTMDYTPKEALLGIACAFSAIFGIISIVCGFILLLEYFDK